MKIDIRPWGQELIIEQNDKYTMKLLTVKPGHGPSLQYHNVKHETFYVIAGTLKFQVGDSVDSLEEFIVTEGFYYVLPPKKIHRMICIGETDGKYIEASTSENEVVRLQDFYGRI